MAFGDIIKGISDFVTKQGENVINSAALAYDIKKDKSLTGAQREANAFSAAEAEKNRLFQSAEADIARQWQEDQYLKYNSPEAMMRQYQDAGLNPALMYGSAAGASASTSTQIPNGAVASSVTPTQNLQMLSAIMGMRKTAAEIENIKKDSDLKSQQYEWNPKLWDDQLKTGKVNRQNMLAGIDKTEAEIDKLIAETTESSTRSELNRVNYALGLLKKVTEQKTQADIDMDVAYKMWAQMYRMETGTSPDQPAWNALTTLLGSTAISINDKLQEWKDKIVEWFPALKGE